MQSASIILVVFTILILANAIMIIFFFVMLQKIKMEMFNSNLANAKKHDAIEKLVRDHFLEIIYELKKNKL